MYRYYLIVKQGTASNATLPGLTAEDYDSFTLTIDGSASAVTPTDVTGGMSVPIPELTASQNGVEYTLTGTLDGVDTDLAEGKIYVTSPSSGGGGDGTVTVENISDATAIGKQLLTSTNAEAVRTAIDVPATADVISADDLNDYIKKIATFSGTPGSTALRQVLLQWAIDTTNPNMEEVRVTDGGGTSNVLSAWRNEWGALRGTSPYSGWGDSLVRAIRSTGDLIGTGAGALKTNAFELVDRRGETPNVMWGRSWVDGHLTRNGISMSDVLYLDDPEAEVPAGLPANTLIARKTA